MATRDSEKLRKLILDNLISNSDYSNKVMPFLNSDFFVERFEKVIFEEITSFYNEFKDFPSKEALKIQVESRSDLNETLYEQAGSFCAAPASAFDNNEFLIKATEEWCRERATINAISRGVAVISGDDKKADMSNVIDLLREAVSIKFDSSIGHDYLIDAEDRWAFYNNKEEKLRSGLDHLDYILKGGIPNKTLGVILAGTGVGKSLFMTSLSSNIIKSGKNVLYITLEMAEEKIAQRIDQNLLNMNSDELETVSRDMFLSRMDKVRAKSFGRLIIKEYPTKSAHAGHFKKLLTDLKERLDFAPDLICVDYLNICGSQMAGKNSNSYEQSKYIAEELRALAMEFQVPVLTATQTNRSGFADDDVNMTSTSESFGVPMTADYMFALTTNDQLRELNQVKMIQLKNRFGSPDDRKNHLLQVDYSKMRVSDLDQQPDMLAGKAAFEAKTTTNASTVMDMSGNWN